MGNAEGAATWAEMGALAWAGAGARRPRRLAATLLLAAVGVASADDALPWFDSGRPRPQAVQAVELLAAAPSHGLAPQDYAAKALREAVQRARLAAPATADAAARLDQALTAAMQRYLSDLHRGRIDPRRIGHDFALRRDDGFDAALVLRSALAEGRLADAVRDAAPRLSQYERLREALAAQRTLLDHPAWRQPLPALPSVPARPGDKRVDRRAGKLEPGADWAGLPLLTERLLALGDLPPSPPLRPATSPASAPAALRYDTPQVDAVRAFQQRHGLLVDGVIGASTLAQLQVDPAVRVRQIELALERLRWTPLLQASRALVVNIPEFVLRAYEVIDGRVQVRQAMKVIVGRAMETRTPLFVGELRFIEFSPYWNVPPSIARHELVPKLRRDPGHLAQQGFEFVALGGHALPTAWTDKLDAVLAGRARLRQRPGPKNALGGIKFVFPNDDHIYLHHTPATALFGRERRDFSHGCIRIEDPLALARFALQDMPEWSDERVRAAMDRGQSSTLRLMQPMPVLIAYTTALVKDGRIHFLPDLYGHDRVLDATLRARSDVPLPPL